MTDTRSPRASVPLLVVAVVVAVAVAVAVAALVLLGVGGLAGWLLAGPARGAAASADVAPSATPGADLPERDFFFQVIGYDTANQGGQTMNLYFHYRYEPGYHGTTFTVGDIEPLAVPGPSTSVDQCAISDPTCRDEQ